MFRLGLLLSLALSGMSADAGVVGHGDPDELAGFGPPISRGVGGHYDPDEVAGLSPPVCRGVVEHGDPYELAGLTPPVCSGVGEHFDPDELAAIFNGSRWQVRGLSVHLQGARWLGRGRPAPATARLVPPPGAWTDLELRLDGPVTLTLDGLRGPVTWRLDLGDTWTVPLEDPDATGPMVIALVLPAWAAALGDVTPDHPAHDALAAAIRDGALLSPRAL